MQKKIWGKSAPLLLSFHSFNQPERVVGLSYTHPHGILESGNISLRLPPSTVPLYLPMMKK